MATVAPEVPVLARDEAFEKLYRRYVTDVYHYALALLRNPADAEDVTQTTFMNAYRAFRRGDEILKPQNWLIKIAHNVARTRYARMSRRVKEVPLEEHVEQLAFPEEERPDVQVILRALGRLPFNQRAAIVMRELEGRSYAEIADTLGVSVAAVETLIFRARRSLRVSAAALRSIAAVPVPSSLLQLFGGGGAVAGGLGAGVVVKAAVALVAGALATGLGGDHGGPAVASSDARAAPTSAAQHSFSPSGTRAVTTGRLAKRAQASVPRGSRTGNVRPSALPGSGTRPAAGTTQGQASAPASSSGPALPAPLSNTVEAVSGTVEQTVSATASALPIQLPSLPQLPVPTPVPPKLP